MVKNQETQDILRQSEEAHRDLEFFIDLLTHDVPSQTMITYSCLEELKSVIDEQDEDSQFFLQTAFQSLLRAQMVLDQVKLLSEVKNLQNGDYTPIDLCGVVNRSITSIIGMFPHEKIKINTSFPKKHCFVQGTTILDNCVINLLQNAVLADKNPIKVVDIIVSDIQESDQWKIDVIDRGEGIPDSKKEKIFKRFFRVRSEKRGSGLGLHIVKTILKKLGGEISVSNRVLDDYTQGTRFEILLPKIEITDFPTSLEA
ncbi:MAG: HAMP domain-containing histidine kinase [Candidatus Heimdallarchaeota archaeon]|nr:MAG: HAMP domain-containing histidine kinase [Candidatus Heimdallarchaeota archaeon]